MSEVQLVETFGCDDLIFSRKNEHIDVQLVLQRHEELNLVVDADVDARMLRGALIEVVEGILELIFSVGMERGDESVGAILGSNAHDGLQLSWDHLVAKGKHVELGLDVELSELFLQLLRHLLGCQRVAILSVSEEDDPELPCVLGFYLF